MTAAERFKERMFRRARLEDAVVRAACTLVDHWHSTDPWDGFGDLEDDLIIAVHNYRAGLR